MVDPISTDMKKGIIEICFHKEVKSNKISWKQGAEPRNGLNISTFVYNKIV
jgi:hypothetical protein